VFVNGELHNGPFTYVKLDGWGVSLSLMHNGRPAEGCIETKFYPNGWETNVDSLLEETDVSGW
jgi:hypothetical protein